VRGAWGCGVCIRDEVVVVVEGMEGRAEMWQMPVMESVTVTQARGGKAHPSVEVEGYRKSSRSGLSRKSGYVHSNVRYL
jgi:hypothetical protein